ncbi:16S rRNA (guanine(966)-N(2))-methyltransferase RsmD [Candidatus Pelagibacter sp.]|uniref:16S rRNA (guanine(966)-N(2))-methyltransferase RsmD n=1 Tax=Candidatus Pelagibacter sp. TaxID=2024849 RepID=UPI003F86CDFD|tara:strand:- start:1390 stop:1950 length:561 start_codon:yes stop_codon:yes gene_type:complete
MRIISGILKGKKINEPKDIKTRPLKDLTKESIFNIIAHTNKFKVNLTNANVLDLFSGVGSFGIECLSRGAKKVVFIENYNGVLPILKKNLSYLKENNNYEILNINIYEDETFIKLDNKFDIIFLDPPYRDKHINKLLLKIKKTKILNQNGIIILHRNKKEVNSITSDFKIVEEKTYGISKIIFVAI